MILWRSVGVGKFSDRVSSEKPLAVSAAGPPAAFFPEIDMSGFFGHAHFGKKCDFAQIRSDFVSFNLGALKDWNLWTSGPFGPLAWNPWAPRPFGPGLVPC